MRRGSVRVLAEKTANELGVDINALSPQAHTHIWVTCASCHEQFLREYRLLYQSHACPAYLQRDDTWQRRCLGCGHYRQPAEFAPNGICQICNAPSIGEPHLNDDCERAAVIYKWIAAKRFGGDYDSAAPTARLVDQWWRQGGKCYYSGLPLTIDQDPKRCAVLDRLDTDIYVWCCLAMADLKRGLDTPTFIGLLEEMGFAINELPVRLEGCYLDPEARRPFRKRTTDAGHDLFAVKPAVVPAGRKESINTGIAIAVPEGYYYTIEGRSGIGMEGIEPFRGIIDATYTGELIVSLRNWSDNDYLVGIGDRIAQLVLHRHHPFDLTMVQNFSPPYKIRGQLGFGSSGI